MWNMDNRAYPCRDLDLIFMLTGLSHGGGLSMAI